MQNTYLKISLSLLLSLPSLTYGRECSFPPRVEGLEWDAFWGQHLVGADLLREELEAIKDREDYDPAAVIRLWDSSGKNKDKHGERMSQLVAGPRASAVIPLDEPIAYVDGSYLSDYERDYRECDRRGGCATYIGNSIEWDHLPFVDLLEEMSAAGTTLVTAAGGNDSEPINPSKRRAAESNSAILVTALDHWGMPASFTAYGDVATIGVPVGEGLAMASYNFAGDLMNSGGQSSATALVAGSLGGFTLLSGFHPSTAEAAVLLSKTAIPNPHFPRGSSLLGDGILNAYKMGRVGLRLKEQCGHTSGIRRNRCMSELLHRDESYRFEEESRLLFREGAAAFPECFGVNGSVLRPNGVKVDVSVHIQGIRSSIYGPPYEVDDCRRTRAFHALRRAALLNHSNRDTWKALYCVRGEFFTKGVADLSSDPELLYLSLSGDKAAPMERICRGGFYTRRFVKYLSAPFLAQLLEMEGCEPNVYERASTYLLSDPGFVPRK